MRWWKNDFKKELQEFRSYRSSGVLSNSATPELLQLLNSFPENVDSDSDSSPDM
jgi:hypothetical protein